MKITSIIAVVIITVLLAMGCRKQKATNPEYIYQYYEVLFNPTYNGTTAWASFTVNEQNGPELKFTNNEKVKMNGEMSRYAPGTFSWGVMGMRDVIFTVVRNDGAILSNTVEAPPPGYLVLEMDSVLHVTDTMHVRWTGLPLQPEEIVWIAMTRENDSIQASSSIGPDFFHGSNEHTFDFAQTRHFTPGTYRVELVKQRTTSVQQSDGNAGGKILISVVVMGKVVVK